MFRLDLHRDTLAVVGWMVVLVFAFFHLMATTVDIRDQVGASVAALKGGIAPARINPMIGAAETRLFQNWFLDNPPNKSGFPSTGFWADAARSTNFHILADGVLISVNKQGVRQRYQGGEIKPLGGRKYLTIPARAEAYGKRALEFDNLRLAFHRVGGRAEAFALVESDATQVSISRKRKDGSRKITQRESIGGAVMYWLVKSVRQAGNKDVLPPDNLILATAIETIEDAVDRALKGNAGGAK